LTDFAHPALQGRPALAAAAARRSMAGSCDGWRSNDPATRKSMIDPVLLNAMIAACGRVLSPGSQMARSTAKGRLWAVATSATAPDSRSMASAPVLARSAALPAAVMASVVPA